MRTRFTESCGPTVTHPAPNSGGPRFKSLSKKGKVHLQPATQELGARGSCVFNPLNAELNPICYLMGIIRSSPFSPR